MLHPTVFFGRSAFFDKDYMDIKEYLPILLPAFASTVWGFHMKIDGKPILVWDFNSLKTALETVYAFLVSSAD